MRPTPAFLVPILVLAAAGCGARRDTGPVHASGHVEATDVRLASKVGGRLVFFPLEEGTVVKLGEVIARVDTTDQELLLRQARADREQAAAELALRLAGARKEDIAELEAEVAAQRADLDGAQRDLDRMQGLLDRGSGTVKSRDDAKTRRDVAAKRLAATQEALARARNGSRPEEIAAARARVAAAEARVAQLEQQIADASTASPLDGVVTSKLVEPGELIAAGTALAVVSDLAKPWLTVYVGEPDLPRVKLGGKADVRTDDGQARVGTVSFVSPEAEFTPKNVQTRDERVKLVYKVKIALENADGLFKPGMPAEASFREAGAGR